MLRQCRWPPGGRGVDGESGGVPSNLRLVVRGAGCHVVLPLLPLPHWPPTDAPGTRVDLLWKFPEFEVPAPPRAGLPEHAPRRHPWGPYKAPCSRDLIEGVVRARIALGTLAVSPARRAGGCGCFMSLHFIVRVGVLHAEPRPSD
jgi:hypothetical protein